MSKEESGKDSSSGTGSESKNNEDYQLGNSDNPGSILISKPLTGYNYQSWARPMKNSAWGQGKIRVY